MARKGAVEEEIRQLQKTLDMLKYKCWYYETAIADGNEERIAALPGATVKKTSEKSDVF